MKYTEEQAAALLARGVPAATIRTWKKRGEIPDGYENRVNRNPKHFAYCQALMGNALLVGTKFLPAHIGEAIRSGKANSISPENYEAALTACTTLRKRLLRATRYPDNEEAVRWALLSKEVNTSTLLAQIEGGDKIYHRIRKNLHLHDDELPAVVEIIRKLLDSLPK